MRILVVNLVVLCATALAADLHGEQLPLIPPTQANDPADLVMNLPGIDKVSFKQYAGYATVNASEDANLFYWFFEAQNIEEDTPVVLWLSGGPGCSSAFALFYENGPFQLNDDFTLRLNPYSWNMNAHLIFVDQPVGTGFSYIHDESGYVRDEKTLAEHLYRLLQQFFVKHPEYAKQPFYIFGESYAGHYLPAVAARIAYGNPEDPKAIPILLKGIGIGNGMTDPRIQYGYYAEFAYSHGLIDYQQFQIAEGMYSTCREALLQEPVEEAARKCAMIPSFVLRSAGAINYYDVRMSCVGLPRGCYDFLALPKYLMDRRVQEALHIINWAQPVRKWVECDNVVYDKFSSDWFVSQRYEIPVLLDHYRVLIYAGDHDFICNFLGNQAWVREMEWSHAAEYRTASRTTWAVDGTIAGYAKSSDALTFLVVRNAGHMAPMDQPKNTLDMLNRFTRNKPFDDQL